MRKFLSILCVLALGGCQSAEERNCPNTRGAKIGAHTISQSFVSQRLRDAESADFSEFRDSNVTWLSHCKFRVESGVRATNAFGAYITKEYSIVVEYLPGEEAFQASEFVMP